MLGVIHVGRLDHRPFTAGDAELLPVAAERVLRLTDRKVQHFEFGKM
ncbi:MAG: hypothetical protein ABI232_02610 [Jatrophihabitantaceae bacterium]